MKVKGSHYRVAIIKSCENDFERYYNEKLKEYGCTVLPLELLTKRVKERGKQKIRFSQVRSLALKNYELVVVFDYAKIVPLIRFKMHPKSKLVLWNWNVRNNKDIFKEKIVSPFCDIWTFDINEALKNGWKLNRQFYIPSKFSTIPVVHTRRTAFCACIDKKRYYLMKEIRNVLLKKNIECHFFLVKDGSSEYMSEDTDWIRNEGISYNYFLKYTVNSDVIVDLVKPGQRGLTVRTLEALFYNKKLITNNPDIIRYPFYNESNIYLWNQEKSDTELDVFLKKEYEPVPEELKQPYTVEAWIDTFIHG